MSSLSTASTALEQQPAEQDQQNLDRLQAANAIAEAKKALAAANAEVARAPDAAAKKAAERILKQADTKLQLAELWGLCSSGPEGSSSSEKQLRALLNINIGVMHHAVYRLFGLS